MSMTIFEAVFWGGALFFAGVTGGIFLAALMAAARDGSEGGE